MRIEAARKLLKEKGLDAAFLASPANIQYLSGFAGTDSYLYLSAAGRRVILTDSRYTLQAEEEGENCEVRTIQGERVYGVLLKELLEEDRVSRLGFEDGVMTWQMVKKLQDAAGSEKEEERWVPLGESVSLLRAVKDDEELARLARAEQIGDEAFSYILTQIRPGITELEIAAKLEYYMKSHGAQEKSFEMGDFLNLVFGCKYQGYCSDMTRTVVIGKASEKQKEIYRIVLEAQEAALAGLRSGLTGAQGDKLARAVIEQAGYGEYFGHGLGHSVGLEIHEKPALSSRDETVLKLGMIETVEPGIYIPGFGGVRIEDMVVITESGVRNLTGSPKGLIEV